MSTRVLFFGRLRDAAGAGERVVDLPQGVCDLASLIEWLAEGDEVLQEALRAPLVRIAIDQVLVGADAALDPAKPPGEVAFMAPFSGG